MATTTLYETDFYAWTQAQAEALHQAKNLPRDLPLYLGPALR